MRKPVFSREDVVAAGLALVRREGMALLTARRVAEELESSTAPVYSNFESMEELGQAVLRRAVRELLGLMRQNHTGDEFLNLGVGLLKFAVDEPRLYAALFLEGHGDYEPARELFAELVALMPDLPELDPLPLEERVLLLKKLAIYTTGMAAMLCRTCHEDCDVDLYVLLLREVGESLIRHAHQGMDRTPEDTVRLGGMLAELLATVPGNANPEEEKKS